MRESQKLSDNTQEYLTASNGGNMNKPPIGCPVEDFDDDPIVNEIMNLRQDQAQKLHSYVTNILLGGK